MFEDYRLEVLRAYGEKKARGELSYNLSRATAAKLRDECVVVFNSSRYLKEEERLLKSFFGLEEGEVMYEQAIKKFDPDRFRPLILFLKKGINTDEINIEILAWLIDFQPRPCKVYTDFQRTKIAQERDIKTSVPELEPGVISERGEEIIGEEETDPGGGLSPTKGKMWLSIAILLLLLLTGFGTYVVITDPNGEGCMYWAGDQYQPVSCDQKFGHVPTIGLDTARLAHFKQIPNGKVTRAYFGKIWYLKKNNRVDFFSANGNHPVYIEKHLVPASLNMIDKWGAGKK